MVSAIHLQPPDNLELKNLVHPRQRSHVAEARWQGNLYELQVGMLVATLARGDKLGHPFWIAKIIEIIKGDEGNQVKSIVVHWYHTSSKDAFTGKYSSKMVKDVEGTSRKQRRKNLLSTSTPLDNVDILIYDFSLNIP